ncbi:MAG: CHAD domain-containing protein [Thaumarchaeota archaeon]|nr:CHAD domain-containing protein [Nitrososphaerota archaeon]
MKESLEIDKKLFLKKFKKITDMFSQKLQDYIKNPNDENIHDIRVVVRRLETAFQTLPKSERKSKKIKNYIKQAKMLFKLNAKIRDIDIICAKMESKYQEKTHEMITSLKKLRIENLQNANELALKILHLSIPKISADIGRSKLNKRYLKVLDRIELDIQKNTIIALGDERRVEELHMLRKDFKKLRYSLELISNKEKISQVLKNLKDIQDMLGDIHDSDIIIEYLNTEHGSKYSDIKESEILERRKKYNAFVTAFKKRKSKTSNFNLEFQY